MGRLVDGSHIRQGHQAWTAVGLPPRYGTPDPENPTLEPTMKCIGWPLSKSFLVSVILSYFVSCSSLVFLLVVVLHSLYRAAVSALFSLVVLLITLCEVACCTIVCANNAGRKGRTCSGDMAIRNFPRWRHIFIPRPLRREGVSPFPHPCPRRLDTAQTKILPTPNQAFTEHRAFCFMKNFFLSRDFLNHKTKLQITLQCKRKQNIYNI